MKSFLRNKVTSLLFCVALVLFPKPAKADSITGCVAQSSVSLTVQNEGDKKSYTLLGDTDGIKAGNRIHVSGKKRKDANGKPHFLVATLGPGGASLYVDGVRDRFDPAQTTAETYTGNETVSPTGTGPTTPDGQGYWRVGWDDINGWGATDYGLAGVVDEAALFENKALTPAEVASLWSTNHW